MVRPYFELAARRAGVEVRGNCVAGVVILSPEGARVVASQMRDDNPAAEKAKQMLLKAAHEVDELRARAAEEEALQTSANAAG
ncbi:MAG TPA: hypothetical protein VF765_31030 [Polyangiaceae bacterium]